MGRLLLLRYIPAGQQQIQNFPDGVPTRKTDYYRPQQSWAKVMFLQASVILSTGGVCLSACLDTTPPESRHPPRSRPPRTRLPGSRHPLGADPPGSRHPLGPEPPGSRHPPGTRPPVADTLLGADPPRADTPLGSRHPPGADPPGSRHPSPPPWEADASIRSMSGRYAFLLKTARK